MGAGGKGDPVVKQKTKFRYAVDRNEKVTITITPVSVGPRVTASENEEPLDNIGSQNKPKFRFEATQVPGNSHFVILDFDFFDDDADDSLFQIDLSGSGGGNFPDVHRVKKTNKVHRPVFRFEVTA